MYDVEISHATLSEITERVIPQVKEWQSRPLESLYTIVWLDAMQRTGAPVQGKGRWSSCYSCCL